jgi:hypothetical protein
MELNHAQHNDTSNLNKRALRNHHSFVFLVSLVVYVECLCAFTPLRENPFLLPDGCLSRVN